MDLKQVKKALTPLYFKQKKLKVNPSLILIFTFILSILAVPHFSNAWIILSDDFNYLGEPDPFKWFIPEYLDETYGEAYCDGSNLFEHTWGTGVWTKLSHIYVFSQRNFDAQNNDAVSMTFTIYDGYFTDELLDQQSWAEIGFMPSYMIDPLWQENWCIGVWVVVSETSFLPGNIQIGIQDVSGQGVPHYAGDFPVTITMELEPNIGDVGGVARCYIEGEPGVWDEKEYGKSWFPTDPITEDFSDCRAYLSMGTTYMSPIDGYVWYDSASIDYPADLPQLNSIILSDTDSGSEEYSNSLTVSVDPDVEYPAEVGYIRFQESPAFYYSDAPWITYSDPVEATFPTPGDGPRTLYAQVCDPTQTYISNVVFDDIFIDTNPPSSTILPLDDTQTEAVFTLDFTYNDPEPASGVELIEIWYLRQPTTFQSPETTFSPVALNQPAKTMQTFPVSQSPQEWTLYATVSPPTQSIDFDSSTTGGDGYYQFISIAEDIAGNREPWPDTPDTSTNVDTSEEDEEEDEELPRPGHDCITPNGDGINDFVFFYFPNPNNAVADLTIFDRNLVHVYHTSAVQPAWYATDDAGALVEGGLYLFQILVEGKVYNGSVLVAR